MQQLQYELSVLVNGRPIREYGLRGLTFIEGRKDQNYTIRFRNNSAQKVLAVVSVDGLDVVDGKPATNESRGYIVPAYSATEIKGWRTSTESVNEFVFTGKPEGYSAQTQGDDSNSGVIAVKVFAEQVELASLLRWVTTFEEHHHHYHHEHIYPREPYFPQTYPIVWCSTSAGGMGNPGSATAANLSYAGDNVMKCSNIAAPTPPQELPDFNLGTGWGAERKDKIDLVDFKRGIELSTLQLYYSDEEGLVKAGVEVDKKPAVTKPTLPKGFNGFCVPPKTTKA